MAIVVIPRRMPYGDILLLPEYPPDECAVLELARQFCQAYSQDGGYHLRDYARTLAKSKRIEVGEAETLPVVAEFRALGNTIRIVTACSNKALRTRLVLSGCKTPF